MHEHEQTHRKTGRRPTTEKAAGETIASRIGNAAMARLAQGEGIKASGGGPNYVDHEIARAIDAQRGRGRELDSDARGKLENAMGDDFSDVRIHDDDEAHELSKSVSAEAFTTGSDVFFQSGKYEPQSSAGQKLLAHELTHVSQQRGAPRASQLTVSDPGDASEVEATGIAESVSSASPASQPTAAVSRAAEEEELQASRVDREAAPEEEEPAQA
jgi:hypothetical protein